MADGPSNFNKSPMWIKGIEMWGQITTWIVAPIVLAVIFGKMLDRRYGTEPKIFLVFAGIAFLTTCYGIVKIARDYIKNNNKK